MGRGHGHSRECRLGNEGLSQLLKVWLSEIGVIIVVIVGSVTDIVSSKIPNWLTYPAAAFGVALAAAEGGWNSAGNRLLGLAVGFGIFFVLYWRGGMGGGDVKLMAAVGAMMGYPFVLNAMITSILLGGLIAALIVIWEGKAWAAARYVWITLARVVYRGIEAPALQPGHAVPFGVAICLGSFLTLVANWRGHSSPAGLLMEWYFS